MKLEIWSIVGAVLGLVSAFGWSHSSLRTRMNQMEEDMHKKLGDQQARILIEDKLAPLHVEYRSLSRRIGEMQGNQKALEVKLDKVLDICRNLNGKS